MQCYRRIREYRGAGLKQGRRVEWAAIRHTPGVWLEDVSLNAATEHYCRGCRCEYSGVSSARDTLIAYRPWCVEPGPSYRAIHNMKALGFQDTFLMKEKVDSI